ncbi:helix-turn-helix domain-containing protein [Peristeroidobacter soli]|jgi:cytoskeletal protein RodZ|uniref:helix-turn-helix domain-containing protein n=1 Tax=Peristeroidobacter soli TaxID=2497877 RepID=UPI00101CC2A8|nr:helix-turn-helix domain-containing protein [Peristeroidobacter soli]
MRDVQLQLREFGRALRNARVQQQLSVDDASKECLLSDRQILGLEGADLRPFYSPRYALRGAERYAKYLGVAPVPHACIASFGTEVLTATASINAR